MSLFRNMLKRYNKQCETAENHIEDDLKTRYYKGNFNQLFQAVEEIFKSDKQARVVNQSRDHGEIAVEVNRGQRVFLIITIINVKPLETAVDINASTDSSLLTGIYPYLKSEIHRLYKKLDRNQTYIGAGKSGLK